MLTAQEIEIALTTLTEHVKTLESDMTTTKSVLQAQAKSIDYPLQKQAENAIESAAGHLSRSLELSQENQALRSEINRFRSAIESLGPPLSLDLRLAHIPIENAVALIIARIKELEDELATAQSDLRAQEKKIERLQNSLREAPYNP